MTIKFWCARCGQAFTAPRELAGRRSRCRLCGHIQAIPRPAEDPPEASVYALAAAAAAAPPPPAPSAPGPDRRQTRERARPSAWTDRVREFTEESSQVQGLSVLLLILSAADLFMTYLLMQTSPRFVESNPIAQWFFHRWNIGGMAIYKFLVIGSAIAMSEVIERRRPGWGKLVLTIGCVAAAWVLWYSLRLYMGFTPMPAAGA